MSRTVTYGVCLLAVVFSSVAAAEEAAPAEPARPDKLAATADWPGVVSIFHGHNWGNDVKFVDALAKAGFNATGATKPQIKMCRKAGLRVFLFAWPNESIKWAPELKNNKTILSYYMCDRQKPKKFPQLGVWEKQMAAGDPNHPAIYTTRAVWGGLPYFIQVVKPRALEYYHYHWHGGRHGERHFLYLQHYRDEAIKAGGIPVIRIVHVDANPAKFRQTTYMSLAYGVRGLRWWGGGGFFNFGKKDSDGRPALTDPGKEVVRINAAVKAYSPIFKKARSVAVYHTKPLPGWTVEAPKGYWAQPSGEHIVVGFFQDKEKNDFLLVANRDAGAKRTATLTLSGKIESVKRMDKETGEWVDLKTKTVDDRTQVELQLEPGGGELLEVNRPVETEAE